MCSIPLIPKGPDGNHPRYTESANSLVIATYFAIGNLLPSSPVCFRLLFPPVSGGGEPPEFSLSKTPIQQSTGRFLSANESGLLPYSPLRGAVMGDGSLVTIRKNPQQSERWRWSTHRTDRETVA